MKYSKPILQSTSMIFVIALGLAACQSDTKPADKAEPAAVAASASGDTLSIEYGIDLRGTGYAIFTSKLDTSFADLAASIAYLKQLPDSLQRQHFYIVVDDNTDSFRLNDLRRMLPDAGLRDFEVFNWNNFFKTESVPVTTDLNIPKE